MNVEKISSGLKTNTKYLLLFSIVFFSAIYRILIVLREGFPPGADIGLHNSLIHSITQGGSTNFLWNYYHMGGGNSNTFPGYHIFVADVIFFTGLPDYLAQAFVAILFSSLIAAVAFLLTRKVMNESIALIVAFLVAVSMYDIDMLLFAGYPNVITLMLIPLALYLLLEKSRFSRLTFITVTSLVSASIFLTHSLSTFMFITIVLFWVFVVLCFPRRAGVGRKDVLEWLVPLFLGGLMVSPFLVQVAPIYLNLNSAVYTGGLPEIQPTLLSTRLLPLSLVLPFFVCFFLYFVFSKYVHGKIIQFPTILLILWLIIPTVLTQSYTVGLYTDYQRFLYFANLPVIILIGAGIFLGARLLGDNTNQLLSIGRIFLQKRFGKKKITIPRFLSSHLPAQTTVTVFATALILIAFFWLPNFFVTPSEGISMQTFYQVMNKPGDDAIQWVKQYTPTDSVFVSDALYGWWLGGFAQRPTISGVEPQFLTNSREFEPALLATRLLDTDYLVDNGLIQVREDGGYIDRHNPEFLAKLSDSYFPFPFFNFDSNQTTLTFRKSGDEYTVKLSELPVREMYTISSFNFASIYVTWGNELLTFTQEATVYQGVRFVNMTETVSSNNPLVSFDDMNLILQTRGNVVIENDTSVALLDPYTNVAGQLIFVGAQPAVTQVSEGLKILYNLNTRPEIEINFYVAVFEYPNRGSSNATETGLSELFMNNTESYADKVAEFSVDVFDYRQAIANLNASYIAIRDHSQVSKFVKDPMFSLVFINQEVAIFQILQFDLPHS